MSCWKEHYSIRFSDEEWICYHLKVLTNSPYKYRLTILYSFASHCTHTTELCNQLRRIRQSLRCTISWTTFRKKLLACACDYARCDTARQRAWERGRILHTDDFVTNVPAAWSTLEAFSQIRYEIQWNLKAKNMHGTFDNSFTTSPHPFTHIPTHHHTHFGKKYSKKNCPLIDIRFTLRNEY